MTTSHVRRHVNLQLIPFALSYFTLKYLNTFSTEFGTLLFISLTFKRKNRTNLTPRALCPKLGIFQRLRVSTRSTGLALQVFAVLYKACYFVCEIVAIFKATAFFQFHPPNISTLRYFTIFAWHLGNNNNHYRVLQNYSRLELRNV